jgi:hypothetical protein
MSSRYFRPWHPLLAREQPAKGSLLIFHGFVAERLAGWQCVLPRHGAGVRRGASRLAHSARRDRYAPAPSTDIHAPSA